MRWLTRLISWSRAKGCTPRWRPPKRRLSRHLPPSALAPASGSLPIPPVASPPLIIPSSPSVTSGPSGHTTLLNPLALYHSSPIPSPPHSFPSPPLPSIPSLPSRPAQSHCTSHSPSITSPLSHAFRVFSLSVLPPPCSPRALIVEFLCPFSPSSHPLPSSLPLPFPPLPSPSSPFPSSQLHSLPHLSPPSPPRSTLPYLSQERLQAEDACRQLVEQRKAFESERLETAKQRKELLHHKSELSRSADATRMLQLQLVEQFTAPSPPTPPSVPTHASHPPPPHADETDTAEEWRKWVKPQPRPQPIPPKMGMPPLTPMPLLGVGRGAGVSSNGLISEADQPPRSIMSAHAGGGGRRLGEGCKAGGRKEGGAGGGGLERWQQDFLQAESDLMKHQNLLHTVRAATVGESQLGGEGRGEVGTRPSPSPPTHHPRCHSIGSSTVGSANRLSYQFPNLAAMETPSASPCAPSARLVFPPLALHSNLLSLSASPLECLSHIPPLLTSLPSPSHSDAPLPPPIVLPSIPELSFRFTSLILGVKHHFFPRFQTQTPLYRAPCYQ